MDKIDFLLSRHPHTTPMYQEVTDQSWTKIFCVSKQQMQKQDNMGRVINC